MMQYLARLGSLGAASQQDLIWFASTEIGLCIGIVVLRIRASTTTAFRKEGNRRRREQSGQLWLFWHGDFA
jgi:hypothetical protein